jgi:hypothetical protein
MVDQPDWTLPTWRQILLLLGLVLAALWTIVLFAVGMKIIYRGGWGAVGVACGVLAIAACIAEDCRRG